MLIPLIALSLLAPQTTALAGQQVAVTFPAPTPTDAPAGFLEWKGWGYRSTSLSLPVAAYPSAADLRPYADAKPNADAVPWREKVVLFTNTDILDRYPSGLIRQRRGYIGQQDLAESLASIARYPAVLAARTDGKLKFEPDVSIESEFLRGEVTVDAKDPFGLPSILSWVRANVNGGAYQAEDNVYRGPYDGVLAIVAGPFPGMSYTGVVNGTPLEVRYLPDRTLRAGQVEAMLDQTVLNAARERLSILGYLTGDGDPVVVRPEALAPLTDPKPDALNLYEGHKANVAFERPADFSASSWRAPATEITFVQVPDRGNVLHYKELSTQRSGGFALPTPDGGFKTGTLSFYARSKSQSPLSVLAVGTDGKTVRYSLGRDVLPPPGPDLAALPTAFTPNGEWQQVSVDLRPVGQVASIRIEPSPNSIVMEREELDPVEYDLDAFILTDDPAPASPQTSDPDFDDAMKAVSAMQSGKATPELAALLSSNSSLVLLNLVNAYTVVKDPTVVRREPPTPTVNPKEKNPPPAPEPLPSLETLIVTLSPRRQELVLRAVANQDTDEGWSFIRRQALVGVGDIVRGTAAELLTLKESPNNLQLLSTLVDNPGRYAKLKAIEALAKTHSGPANVFLGTFIFHSDPQVKLAVTDTIGPGDNALLDKAMWSAVNEPWDAVRLASVEKLVQARGESYRKQGYAGIRDDSAWVRLAFVQWMAANPSEAHIPALKLALTDSSYLVRAAALEALAVQPAAVKVEDVQALKNDPYAVVQAAYVKLAKAKGFAG